ncbi:hypothetical protein [Micromonospora globbae]|uniref:hypothetical protein n=1 Tax=Micromonospora globbae TaxID=1894969 RepID=UPI003427C789
MIITLGFTESDRSRDYSSFADGYRIGARQTSVTIALDGDGSHLSAQQWAEAVFEASNLPAPAADPIVAAIQHALAAQVQTPLRALSVGDSVTVGGQMWACEPVGWRRIDHPHRDGGDAPCPSGPHPAVHEE